MKSSIEKGQSQPLRLVMAAPRELDRSQPLARQISPAVREVSGKFETHEYGPAHEALAQITRHVAAVADQWPAALPAKVRQERKDLMTRDMMSMASRGIDWAAFGYCWPPIEYYPFRTAMALMNRA